MDHNLFAKHLVEEPEKLDAKKAGGVPDHVARIDIVLKIIGLRYDFDPSFLAQLRYDKHTEDGYSGVCDKALHLFTGHKAIKTEKLNINFIFSDDTARLTQWSYFYGRLPYLLLYSSMLIEHLYSECEPTTDSRYIEDLQARFAAGIIMWQRALASSCNCDAIDRLVASSYAYLHEVCRTRSEVDWTDGRLIRLRDTGARPHDGRIQVKLRMLRYSTNALAQRILQKVRQRNQR